MNTATHNSNSTLLEWRDGQPYSTRFQDVYFSSDNGLAETDYVFLQGNRLAQRFESPHSTEFTIIETGFGTGLNFLCTAKLWMEKAPTHVTLHFISTEKFPIQLSDIATAHALWPELASISATLLQQYPQLLNGEPTIKLFDGRIQLTLLLGDALSTLPQITIPADAWLLDGFAPAKNPDMWQPALFQQMASLSKPGTTFATFTSAGNVRRGLQTAGFTVNKQPGFGKKREMLTGYYP